LADGGAGAVIVAPHKAGLGLMAAPFLLLRV